MSKIKEQAEATLAELRRRGWFQGAYGDDVTNPFDCKVCIWGAFNAAHTGSPYVVGNESADFLNAFEGMTGYGPAHFNDHIARSQQDVENALIKLIEAHS